jgi:hypothetical protein
LNDGKKKKRKKKKSSKSSKSGGSKDSSTDWRDWTLSKDTRCGYDVTDARVNCRQTCSSRTECMDQGFNDCFVVHNNYCGSKPDPIECSTIVNGFPCGVSELVARETCSRTCRSAWDCNTGAGILLPTPPQHLRPMYQQRQ